MDDTRAIPLTAAITDAAEARYLVRMSGLPVFLAGIACFFGLLLVDDAVSLAVTTVVGVALIALGLILRGGASWAVIPTAVLTLGALGWMLFQARALLGLALIAAPFSPSALLLMVGLLFQVGVIAMLVVSGLRGWLWLQRQG